MGPQIVVMGVSGSGKSTIGDLIARELDVPFLDGDSLHPLANVEKMAAGTPLTDEDRWPWLAEVGRALADAGRDADGIVIACSALRRAYRDAILETAPQAYFVHLHGARDVLARRMEGRTDHFMPASLLDSQLATLEELGDDEAGIVIDVDQPVDDIVSVAREAIASR